MIKQEIRLSFLFVATIFTILAIGEYFGDNEAYPGLIGTAFVIHLLGNIADLVLGWQIERRKQDLSIDQREYDRLMTRQAD